MAVAEELEELEKIRELCENQLATCQQLVRKYPKVELLEKSLSAVQLCLDKLGSASDKTDSVSNSKVINTVLSNFTQSCLDSTYHQECQLVDKEFLDPASVLEIKQIIKTLSRPLFLCQLMGSEVIQLGTEVIECLHWRVGALLYMYSHMVLTVEERRKRVNVEHFKEALCVGVGHLSLMLSTRAPLSKDEDYVSQDATVPILLEKGIFSDLHMLSLMYAGEMCHWYWELDSTLRSLPSTHSSPAPTNTEGPNKVADSDQNSQVVTAKVPQKDEPLMDKPPAEKEPVSSVSKGDPSLWIVMELTQGVEFARQWLVNFDPQKFGVDFLSKYIDVARGPLKEQSWNYTKAVQLLVGLRKAARKP